MNDHVSLTNILLAAILVVLLIVWLSDSATF
jgi:hypothetical protein